MLISSSHLSSTYNILAYISPQERSTHNSVLDVNMLIDVRGIVHFHHFLLLDLSKRNHPKPLRQVHRSKSRAAQDAAAPQPPEGPPAPTAATQRTAGTAGKCWGSRHLGHDGDMANHEEKMGNWGENILTHWENDHEFCNYHVVVSLFSNEANPVP